MKWTKKGLVFKPNFEFKWMLDRAIGPVPELVSEDVLRIYFSTRDKRGRSTPIYLETDPKTPENIRNIMGSAVLSFGPLGSFDDNGILVSSIVAVDNIRYMYYIGWSPRVTVSYHLSIGLAMSENAGPFRKYSNGPLLGTSTDEPFFNTAPFVIKDTDGWKMWYVSCKGWKMVNNKTEPLYNIKIATSNDGINWKRTGRVALKNDEFAEAIGKPFVYKENALYKMIYSYRNSLNYRTNSATSYRLGYAESSDGLNWIRLDDKLGLTFSKSGWDSTMMEYASGYRCNNKFYLLYNGNGFGESGFGYAILENE